MELELFRGERKVYRVRAETQKPKEQLHMITNESRCNKAQLDKNANIFLKLEIIKYWDFPGSRVVKNPPANAGDTGSSPGPGRSHMSRSN